MDFTFDGAAIVAGHLSLPACGAGTADLFFAEPDTAPEVGTRGALAALGTSRVMTVAESGEEGGYARVRLVAGAGKLDAELEPRQYQGCLPSFVATDCLTDAGEEVGQGWSLLDDRRLQWWNRPRASLRECLRRLARLRDDLRWRIAPDGSVELVSETWPDMTAHVDRDLFAQPQERLVSFWPADGSVSPGHAVTVFGVSRQLLRVEYQWDGADCTCRAWY